MPLVHFSRETASFRGDEAVLPGYERAFEVWLDHARRSGRLARDSSEDAYRQLWAVLTKWCVGQNPPVRLEALTAVDLSAFIASRTGAEGPGQALSPRYVWRLLHLVDRVLAHASRPMGRAGATPAAELLASRREWRYANAASADPLPEHLDAAQARQLVRHLSGALPPALEEAAGPRQATWQGLRNATAVALQLGAGLSPGDVRAARADGVVSEGGSVPGLPWKIRLPADGLSPEREAPVAVWAARLLLHWLRVRDSQGIGGEHLFPSTRSGKPWGKVAQYQAVRRVLTDAGFDESVLQGGSFRLRHTFALRQLQRGRAPAEVARWLGVVDPAVMTRYQRVLLDPVEGVD